MKEEGEIAVEEDEGTREFGKVKQYNEDKGFAFIVSMVAETAIPPLPTFEHAKACEGLL